jgi:hypothetical protein
MAFARFVYEVVLPPHCGQAIPREVALMPAQRIARMGDSAHGLLVVE